MFIFDSCMLDVLKIVIQRYHIDTGHLKATITNVGDVKGFFRCFSFFFSSDSDTIFILSCLMFQTFIYLLKEKFQEQKQSLFFIVFIRSSPDIRWKCYKNIANNRTKKENIKIYENSIISVICLCVQILYSD